MMKIQEVWALEFDFEIQGVRVLTTDGQYFDIDIDVCKKRLGLDLRNFKRLQLLEFGDFLMTKEELDGVYWVEDGSENPEVLNALVDFIKSGGDKKALEKRNKKIAELKGKFFGFLPYLWLNDFVEYHMLYFEGNVNIYDVFNREQLQVIKQYFRWRSKIIFDEKNASRLLRTKFNKAKELVALMGDADDWYYDGTEDTGFFGGGMCELGHALRYEHYAYSPSLNKHIVFGAQCISDFFEVDPAVLKNIIRAQEYLMNEVKVVVYLIRTGKVDEYRKTYKYDDAWDILRQFKGEFDNILPNGSGWAYFLGAFMKNNLPLTKSLINNLNILRNHRDRQIEANPEMVEIEKVLKKIEKARDEGKIPRTHFVFQVIPTIRKYQRMTKKQKFYIDQALQLIKDE